VRGDIHLLCSRVDAEWLASPPDHSATIRSGRRALNQHRAGHQIGESPHATVMGSAHKLVHARLGKLALRTAARPGRMAPFLLVGCLSDVFTEEEFHT
jgi:hypothetical protein